MKNLFINPNSFYLVNTKTLSFDGPLFYLRKHIYPKRTNIAVIQVFNHLFELEKIAFPLFGAILPTKQNKEEYADITTLRKFPCDKLLNEKGLTFTQLRAVYRKYQLVEQEDLSPFNIQKLYVGNVKKCRVLTSNYTNSEELHNNVYLLMNDTHEFIILQDFLAGKNHYITSSMQREQQEYVDSNSLREISIKEMLLPKVYEKCLQFPERNI